MTTANTMSQSIRVGLFFIFGLGILWSLYETLSGDSLGSRHGYSLEADFTDLQQLKVGDEVRLAGVRVGRVSETKLVLGKARATLFIEDPNKIPEGSIATITTAGLLGNNYIAIKASDNNQVYAPGATIETQYTPDINAVISQIGQMGDRLDSVFAGLESFMGAGGENDEPGLFVNLNNLIVDNRGKIDCIFENFESITHKINQAEGTLGLLINDRGAYDQLMEMTRDIRLAATNLNELLIDAKVGEGALSVLLYDKKAGEEVKNTISNFASFSDKLNSDKSTLGKLVSSDELYTQAEDVLNRVDTAVSSMSESGPISAVGLAGAALF